ncbi:hypothetical protein [Deinococcus planocerae]|uniref:hypothetical protein n=1 Tax=Deinococcus planocerae TaxID=1737569 RepID=UPI000C7EF956|nr:hypothetical protein [Deinococcus planocerae]
MRRRLLVLFTVALHLTVFPTAQAITYRFAELDWGMPRGEAHQRLTRSGWRLVGQGGYGDGVYQGTSEGHPARVTLKYDLLGRLVAVDARVRPAEDRLLGTYQAVKASLTRRYGPPVYSQVSFREPYREGDGRELDALKRDHARYDTVWFDENELNTAARSGVQLEVVSTPFSRLEIRQFYLSDDWTEEYRRRAGPSEETF